MRTSQGNHKGCPYNAHQPGQPQGLPLQCAPARATTRVALQCAPARATTRVAPTMRTPGHHKGCPTGQPRGLPLQCAPARATTRIAPTMRTSQGNHEDCPYFVTIVTAFAPQLRLAKMRLPCMEVDPRPAFAGVTFLRGNDGWGATISGGFWRGERGSLRRPSVSWPNGGRLPSGGWRGWLGWSPVPWPAR